MKSYVFSLVFLGLGSSAFAQSPDSTFADTLSAVTDSVAAAADTVVAAPVTPPPAVAAPITTPATPPPQAPPPQPLSEEPSDIRTTDTYAESNKPSKWYYGATVGFNFWGDVRRISIQPMLARKLTKRLSVGGELGYEYLKDTSGSVDRDYHNYGASVFSRFRLTPRFYAHGEYDMISYDFPGGREVVPFLLVGGGIVQSAGRKVSLYAEVLVDILNDEDSPYNDYEPQVSVGAAVGF